MENTLGTDSLGWLANPSIEFAIYSLQNSLSEIALIILALCVWRMAVHQRIERTQNMARSAELDRLRMQILGIERLQFESEKKAARAALAAKDLVARVRLIELRQGKPDEQIAAALTRAGASTRRMVDVGISHGEAHLLRALNRKQQPQQPTTPVF